MKLFSLRLTTLKSKLYAIVFASFVVRVVAFFVLPATPSSLGPDEGTYGALAKWTEQGLPATDFPLYGAGLYQSARSLVWPAAMFIKFGIDPLQSIRLTATIYGVLSVWIVVFVFLKTLDFCAGLAEYVSRNSLLVASVFAVFAFLPSHFIWSLLGIEALIPAPHIKLCSDSPNPDLSDLVKIKDDLEKKNNELTKDKNNEAGGGGGGSSNNDVPIGFLYDITLENGDIVKGLNYEQLQKYIKDNEDIGYDFKF